MGEINRMEKYLDSLEYVMPILISLWLLFCSWQDFRKKQIHVFLIIIGFIIILINAFLFGNSSILHSVLGIIPGILLVLLCFISRGQIGLGDGLIVSIIGLNVGLTKSLIVLSYSLFGSAFISIILLLFHLANRKKSIPFVPFLFISYLGVVFFV